MFDAPFDASMPLIAATLPVLIFGGPYSNLQATIALIAAASDHGIPPDRMICTGDIVAYGADPQPCIDLIREAGIATIMGNCEEQLAADAADCGCGFTPGSACDTLAGAWFSFARSRLDHRAKRWMAGLPRRIDLMIAGKRLAIVHGAPSRTNRFVFGSDPDHMLADEVALTGTDGVIAGHCGLGFTRLIDDRLWHNAGAIGLPANDGTPRGWYSILTPTTSGYTIETQPLPYDHHAAARAMRNASLPEVYATALETGIWPSLDILPLPERAETATRQTATTIVLPGPIPSRTLPSPDASVTLESLQTLWVNTGTLCNLACDGCYIESSPRNDRLAYFRLDELTRLLDEAASTDLRPDLHTVGFTGGEPFMNPDIICLLETPLARGYDILVLTNAMRPMQRHLAALKTLHARFGTKLALRVSLDHFTRIGHETLRGTDTWNPALAGIRALAAGGFSLTIAARFDPATESEPQTRAGFAALFASETLAIDAADPAQLVLFPELTKSHKVAGVSAAAWHALRPQGADAPRPQGADAPRPQGADAMCRTARMAVHRKGADHASLVACTLLPYEPRFDLGATLAAAARPVILDHPYCAQFCVFGAASCLGVPAFPDAQ